MCEISHSFKGELEGSTVENGLPQEVSRGHSTERFFSGRTEQFVVAKYELKSRQSQPECVNEESIGVSERVTQNRRLVVYEQGGKAEWSF